MNLHDAMCTGTVRLVLTGICLAVIVSMFIISIGPFSESQAGQDALLDGCKDTAVSLCDSYGMTFKNMYLDHGQDVLVLFR